MDEASMEKFEAVESFEATVVGTISPDGLAEIPASERLEELREDAEQPGTEQPVEESPAGEASEEYVCSGCGRTFHHAAGLGRHRQTCRSTRGQHAPAPQWMRDIQEIPGAASTARQMAEEALAQVAEQAKERTAALAQVAEQAKRRIEAEPTAPAFDDTLAGWLEWLVERWETEDSEEERQNRYGELLALAVRQDLPLLRRLLERERAQERAR